MTAISHPQALAADPSQMATLLKAVFPPTAAVLVGVGRSKRHLLQWPGLSSGHIVLIDASSAALEDMQRHMPDAALWHFRQTVLDDESGTSEFHYSSNPNEDGLIAPHKLHTLWPNLRAKTSRTQPTQTLQEVLAEPELDAIAQSQNTWLLIDCLPALRIVQGLDSALAQCSVVWLRVLTDDLAEAEPGTTLTEADVYLQQRHFRRVLCFEENHPKVGQAIYLRDDNVIQQLAHEQIAAESQRQLASLQQAHDDLLKARDILAQERDQQTGQVQEHQAQLQALQQEHSKLTSERDVLANEKAKLHTEREALTQQAAKLTATQGEQAKQLAAQKEELVALQQAHADSIKARDTLVQERDQQTKRLQEHQAQVKTLQQEHGKLAGEREALADEKAQLQTKCEALKQEAAKLTSAQNEQAKQLAAQKEERASLQQAHDELLKTRDTLAQERDQQTGQVQEHQAQLQALQQEHSKLTSERDVLANEKAKLHTEREALTQQAAKLTATQGEQAKQLAAQKEELGALQQAHAELSKAKDALTQERETRAKESQDTIAAAEARTRQLAKELDDTRKRQSILEDELTKAEAQLNLIKQLLQYAPEG